MELAMTLLEVDGFRKVKDLVLCAIKSVNM